LLRNTGQPLRPTVSDAKQKGDDMNQENFQQLDENATRRYQEMYLDRHLKAQAAIQTELTEMVEQEKAFILTDEEERLLRCFRQFRARNIKPGAVFKWQTHPEAGVILAPKEGVLVRDPSDLNET